MVTLHNPAPFVKRRAGAQPAFSFTDESREPGGDEYKRGDRTLVAKRNHFRFGLFLVGAECPFGTRPPHCSIGPGRFWELPVSGLRGLI
jgi:hypothetical protein